MDYEESKFLFFMDYLALMGLCVFLSYQGARILYHRYWLRHRKKSHGRLLLPETRNIQG